MAITTKEEFRSYIKKQLGCGFHKIEISDDQLNDAIDRTVQRYSQYAYDGMIDRIIILDLVKDQQDYILGNDTGEPTIFAIHKILEQTNISSLYLNQSLGDSTMVQQIFRNNTYTFRFVDYYIGTSYLEMYEKILKRKKSYTWDETSQTLHFYEKPAVNEAVALHVAQYRANEADIYNKNWVKEYAVALSEIQWAKNMIKFSGVTMPGGSTLNYDKILDNGTVAREKLEEELEKNYTLNSDFFVA